MAIYGNLIKDDIIEECTYLAIVDESFKQELFKNCELIEQIALEADGDLYQYIIKNVCYDKPVDYLITHGMPCSAPSFYDKRRYFFYLLDKNKKY